MDSLINLTKKLIKFKSTASRPAELKRLVDFVEDYFKRDNFFIKRFEDAGKPSIVVTLKNNSASVAALGLRSHFGRLRSIASATEREGGSAKEAKNPQIFLVGHLDVIEAEEQDFIPKIRGGKLFARGAGDMKGSVACLMKIMKEFSQTGLKPDIGLMLTSDEEIGGVNGVNFLLNKKGYNSKLAIVPDGGEIDKITIKEKGFLRLRVEAQGKSAHGSRPWRGDNAIEKLIEAYLEIKKIFPQVDFKDNWKETINLGEIRGGESINKVPDFAQMKLDIRYTEKTSWRKIYQRIIKKVSKIKGIKVKLIGTCDVFLTASNNFYLKRYRENCQKILGSEVKFDREHGASDACYFAQKRIPVILHMPNCGNVHAKNEWLDIRSQKIYYQISKKFLEGFLAQSVD